MALWHEIDLTTDTDVDLVLGYSCAFHRHGKGYLSGGSGLHGPDDVEEESLFSDYEELELSDCKVSIVDGSATIIYQSGMFNMLDMDFMLRLIKKDVPSLKGAVAGSLNGEPYIWFVGEKVQAHHQLVQTLSELTTKHSPGTA